MTSTIITGVRFTPQEVDGEIVRVLENWLAKAKEGKYCGIAIAGINKVDRNVSTEYHCSFDFINDLIAAATLLNHRIIINETDVG